MESPVTLVKTAFNPSTIIKTLVGLLVVAAIFDLLGYTDALIRPVSFIKSKFMRDA